MIDSFSLIGKTILIVGGSRGIGRATAIQCSKAGGRMIIISRKMESLEKTLSLLDGGFNTAIPLDITDIESVSSTIPALPNLDGVVMCAGIGAMKPFLFSNRSDFEKVFDLNFFSTIEFLRLIIRHNKINKDGSVVFVSSIGGVFNHNVGNSIYGTSKAALNSIMKYCAIELAPKRIRVNCVNPGMIKTEFNNPDILTEEQLKNDIEKYPLKRIGEPEDVANAILFLLSDASSWITGTSLVVDGGLTAQ